MFSIYRIMYQCVQENFYTLILHAMAVIVYDEGEQPIGHNIVKVFVKK